MIINSVVIRVDASVIIGSGHVMRCLNLADRFKSLGVKVVFVCRDYPGNMFKVIEKRGYQCLQLAFDDQGGYSEQEMSDNYLKWLWVSQQQDADETLAVLSKNRIKPDLLVIDHFGLDLEWERCLRVLTGKILVIDDIARSHECDYLLDQNYYANANQRYLEKVSRNCKLFLGPEYFLFSQEMLEQAKNIRKRTELKKIFVFFGGADPENYTLKTLQVALLFPQLEFYVVVGCSNPNYFAIAKFCEQQDNCFLHYNIDYMPRLINECDLGICAGGVNTWERILLKLPSIVYPVAENQVEICSVLGKMKYIVFYAHLNIQQLQRVLGDVLDSSIYAEYIERVSKVIISQKNIIEEIC